MASKLELQISAWETLSKKSQQRITLEILERVLNNADYALRKRKQKSACVTVAADFDDRFAQRSKVIQQTCDCVVRVMRGLRCTVSKKNSHHQFAKMKFTVLEVDIDLSAGDLKKIQEKLREVRRGLKAA